jgi:cytoskeleton protein RodZ
LLLVAAASSVIWMQTRPAVPPAAAIASGAKTAAAPETKAVTPAPPAPPARHESVITTTRAVWVRIIADGVPVVERELPPNTRLPFVAREKIVIRTGNAGAVRLTIGGVDQGALGEFGEVVTRRFDVPR